MRLAYPLQVVEDCLHCKLRADRMFCDLSAESLKSFDALSLVNLHPSGAVLFVEGQEPRGVYLLCSGRVKLTVTGGDGKTLITRVAEPGEVIGLSAVVSGGPHEATAEALEPCQTNFIRREEFLRFLREHGDACLRVAELLSRYYHIACEQIRSLGLSHSAAEKLARLLLEWCRREGVPCDQGLRLNLTLTHEEVASMLGTSRETVTRLLADFRKKQIIHLKGATLVIKDRAALEALVVS
jgi:CRP/FNR family transcriptional regulator, cyclic AMP receptor protein